MSVRYQHSDVYNMYFCTFTCYDWIPLFSLTNSYDLVYNWFAILKKDAVDTVAFVIMPNHLHCILYFGREHFNLNKIISNGKRFMAYEIINRLEAQKNDALLAGLQEAVTEREKRKGQLHKVFKSSFDAKAIFSDKFFQQKLNYIHSNPVAGKWKLSDEYVHYEHSSASFYEDAIVKNFTPRHFRDI